MTEWCSFFSPSLPLSVSVSLSTHTHTYIYIEIPLLNGIIVINWLSNDIVCWYLYEYRLLLLFV